MVLHSSECTYPYKYSTIPSTVYLNKHVQTTSLRDAFTINKKETKKRLVHLIYDPKCAIGKLSLRDAKMTTTVTALVLHEV